MGGGGVAVPACSAGLHFLLATGSGVVAGVVLGACAESRPLARRRAIEAAGQRVGTAVSLRPTKATPDPSSTQQ